MEETWHGLAKASNEVWEEVSGQEPPAIRRDHTITALWNESEKFDTKWRELYCLSRFGPWMFLRTYLRKLAVPLGFAGLYVVLAVLCFPFDSILRQPDSVHHFSIARRYSLTDPQMFAHGLYPGGYPAFLRFFLQRFDVHPLLTGKLLSAFCGLVSLHLVIGIARRLGSESAAVWAGLALMSNQFFVAVSSIEGTDSPAALFQLLALSVVIQNPRNNTIGQYRAIGTGALLGLGYLFRFTSLILVPFLGIYIVAHGTKRRAAMFFLLGFVVTALPQLCASALLTGNPFHNEQVRNIWFALDGNNNWGKFWDLMPIGTSLWDLVTDDPMKFFSNWIKGVAKFFWAGTGWPSFLPLVAIPYLLFRNSMRTGCRLLLVTFTLVPVIVTAIAFCNGRLGLVSILGLSIGVGLLLGDIRPPPGQLRWTTFRSIVPVVFLITVVLMISSWRAVLLKRDIPPEYNIDKLVKSLGIRRVETVATNLTGMFDTEGGWMMPYSWVGDPKGAESIQELLDGREDGDDWQFMALDYHEFFGNFLSVKHEVERGGSDLVPLACRDSVGVYMVRPPGIGAAKVDSIVFSTGPILLAHTWIWDQDDIPIYLFWTTTDTILENCVVQVSLRRADGDIICSHVGEPEMSTYPTTAWKPNTVVADLHLLEPATDESMALLEVCLSCVEQEGRPLMECFWIDKLHTGAGTPFP